ncbi:MAG: hypothetical protein HUK22_08665, partial [Thermoguttaceae bacterium]|nr:hypothetical protein [Thermoguttaceae bacterium]
RQHLLAEDATVVNSTFYGNDAAYGGGLAAEGKIVVANSTFHKNVATAEGGGFYSTGFGYVFNSLIVGNTAPRGVDIRHSQDISSFSSKLSVYYTAYGSMSGGYAVDGCQPGISATDVFTVGELENGVLEIASYSIAGRRGTLLGRIGDSIEGWFYVDSNNEWRNPIDVVSPGAATSGIVFDPESPDFGLIGGFVYQTAQNRDETGEPLSRLALANVSVFCIGASVARETPTELTNIVLSDKAPKVGQTLTTTLTPENATVSYQWYRLDKSKWVAIAGATDSTYTLVNADGGRRLRVAATGTGAYVGTVYAATTKGAVPLETPSTVVTTLDDVFDPYDEIISLREAIAYAQAGETVSFAPELGGKMLTVASEIAIDKPLTIDASAFYNVETKTPGIIIDAGGIDRVFNIEMDAADSAVILIGLALKGGDSDGNGGAVYCKNATLETKDVVFTQNVAEEGGAVYGENARLVFENSRFVANLAGNGAAVYLNGGEATFRDSAAAGNTAARAGGVVCNASGSVVVENSALSGNGAELGGAICNGGELVVVEVC